MNTAEVMTAGLLPTLATAFHVTIPEAGRLVTWYALGIAIGGPTVTLLLRTWNARQTLLWCLLIFIVAQIACGLTTSFYFLIFVRLICAVSTGVFFGVAASASAKLFPAEKKIWAMSIVFGGLMIAQVFGSPMATYINLQLGWRMSFYAVAILAVLGLLVCAWLLPDISTIGDATLRSDISFLSNWRLWLAYLTNALNLAAVYAVIGFISPFLTDESEFTPDSVPALLVFYGSATVLGNMLIGRLAGRRAVEAMIIGQSVLALTLIGMFLFYSYQWLVVLLLFTFGCSGVSLSAARAARVLTYGQGKALAASLNTTFVNIGIIIGSLSGSFAIEIFKSIHVTALVGAAFAVAGIITAIPELIALPVPKRQNSRRTDRPSFFNGSKKTQ